ncbi:MAG TPA: hypothetical protein PLX97_00270 [Gemmatales bacterium]|nr:hypothetical protein [Gemmatales bacterium]
MSATPAVPVKRRRWRSWHVFCLVIVLLVGGLWGYRAWRQGQMEARLRNAIATIEQDDPNWRLDSLEREYEARPISPAFLKAVKAFPPGYRGWCGDDIPYRQGALEYQPDGKEFNVRLPESYFQILKERLLEERVQPLRQALLELMNEPAGYRLPTTGKNNYRELDDARRLANKLADEMIYAAHQGDTNQVIQAFELVLRNASHPEACPTPLHQLVTLSLMMHGYENMKRALAFCQFSDVELREVDQLLNKFQPPSTRQIIRFARASDFVALEEARHDPLKRQQIVDIIVMPVNNPSWQVKLSEWGKRLVVELALLNLSEMQAEWLESTQTALQIPVNQPHELHLILNQVQQKTTNMVLKTQWALLSKVLTARLTHQAHIDTLRLALACERFRLAKGQWPGSLQMLVPEYVPQVPVDPYTGQPLLYRVLPDGVVIYTVHTDGKDDGGMVLESNGAYPRDRGTRLFNPAQRGLKYEAAPKKDPTPGDVESPPRN